MGLYFCQKFGQDLELWYGYRKKEYIALDERLKKVIAFKQCSTTSRHIHSRHPNPSNYKSIHVPFT
jgi:hypothetical protein